MGPEVSVLGFSVLIVVRKGVVASQLQMTEEHPLFPAACSLPLALAPLQLGPAAKLGTYGKERAFLPHELPHATCGMLIDGRTASGDTRFTPF